jgi:hypothetical protein
MIFVTVNEPAGRALFVDGNYANDEGLIPVTVMLQAGPHLFETVETASGKPDYQARTDNTVGDGSGVTLVLVKIP